MARPCRRGGSRLPGAGAADLKWHSGSGGTLAGRDRIRADRRSGGHAASGASRPARCRHRAADRAGRARRSPVVPLHLATGAVPGTGRTRPRALSRGRGASCRSRRVRLLVHTALGEAAADRRPAGRPRRSRRVDHPPIALPANRRAPVSQVRHRRASIGRRSLRHQRFRTFTTTAPTTGRACRSADDCSSGSRTSR